MQITLEENEINQAVEAYVRNQIVIASNQSLAITFSQTRGPAGLTATLAIQTAAQAPMAALASVVEITPPARTAPVEVPVTRIQAQKPVIQVADTNPPADAEVPNISTGAEREEPALVETPVPAKVSPFAKLGKIESTDELPPETQPETQPEAPAADAPKVARSIFSKAAVE